MKVRKLFEVGIANYFWLTYGLFETVALFMFIIGLIFSCLLFGTISCYYGRGRVKNIGYVFVTIGVILFVMCIDSWGFSVEGNYILINAVLSAVGLILGLIAAAVVFLTVLIKA